MGIIEMIAMKVAKYVADRVIGEIKARLRKHDEYMQIYEKHDRKKNEMAEELAQADTQEERDAILRKIYNSRPTFE